MLCPIMQPQAETSPSPSSLVHTKVPAMRTPHMPTMLKTKGIAVLPAPCSMPSITMETP